MTLSEVLEQITPVEEDTLTQARRHWDTVAHPLNSLGMLEDAIVRIAGAQHTPQVHLDKKCVVAMCADNGVVEEGVSQSGQEVTAVVVENMGTNTSSVCRMARVAGAEVIPVNIGVATPIQAARVRNCCIRPGTGNFTKESAMTEEECQRAILVGVELVEELAREGYDLIGTGEMGIGNTTTSAAVLSVLLEQSPAVVTGRGAGLTSAGLERKIHAIEQGIALHRLSPQRPLEVLQTVGGLDIAGLVGVFLGGARFHIPVVIDGLISSTAALVAARLCPAALGYMVASHASNEPAGRSVLEALGLEAPIHARMCLGEGTGGVALMPLLDMALNMYRDMCSFTEYEIDAYEHLS